MRTPAGIECPYFFGDYYRGREKEECRLLLMDWKPAYCRICPVPSIARANACPSMYLSLEIVRPWYMFFRPRLKVKAICSKTKRENFDPHIGCGECHSVIDVFGQNPKYN